MGKIVNCEWKDKQPGFLKDVEIDGEIIATIHAFTKNDYSEIERRAGTSFEYDGEGNPKIYMNATKTVLLRLYYALKGHKDVGWNFDRDITLENIGNLPDRVFDALVKAVTEFESQNEVSDGISKN